MGSKRQMISVRSRLDKERNVMEAGFELVVGVDEAGRGPLAGPVTAAAAAVLDYRAIDENFLVLAAQVDDSKKVSPPARERLYSLIISHPALIWGVASVSPAVIDRINILNATKLAMERAVENLLSRGGAATGGKTAFLLIDGNAKIKMDLSQETIIGGDAKIFSISAASIIAKVRRDRYMAQAEQKFPGYGFSANKGYGTEYHFAALRALGPCRLHRTSFYPINSVGGEKP